MKLHIEAEHHSALEAVLDTPTFEYEGRCMTSSFAGTNYYEVVRNTKNDALYTIASTLHFNTVIYFVRLKKRNASWIEKAERV